MSHTNGSRNGSIATTGKRKLDQNIEEKDISYHKIPKLSSPQVDDNSTYLNTLFHQLKNEQPVDVENFFTYIISNQVKTMDDIVKTFLKINSTIDIKALQNFRDSSLCKWLLNQIQIFAKTIPKPTKYWPVDVDKISTTCNTVQDVQAVINRARDEKKIVRVAGAQHSTLGAVFDFDDTSDCISVILDGDLRQVQKLNNTGLYRMGAGCNLGVDPHNEHSTKSNSFNRIVDQDGFALPILGGISHQTIGGFLSTSTAGGTLDFCLLDCLTSIEIVDGTGTIKTLVKGQDDFFAAGVSMGLFGIITHVTLQLQPKYFVKGTEQTVTESASILNDGESFVKETKENQYVHSVWFPNDGCKSVLQFIGNQNRETNEVSRVPYVHPLECPLKDVVAAVVLWLANLYDKPGSYQVVGFLLNLMNPIDTSPRIFNDYWWRCLPNDDLALVDTLIRVQFTEIWIDIAYASQVIDTLKELFKNPACCGSFGIEMYVAKRSDMWMSMSYNQDVIRVDAYWFEYNTEGSLDAFFTYFWNAILTKFPSARLHWGKHFPAAGTQFKDPGTDFSRTIGSDYCNKSYPKFKEWNATRDRFDPHQIFVSPYWRKLLGIQNK